jgi:hypothetical protein
MHNYGYVGFEQIIRTSQVCRQAWLVLLISQVGTLSVNMNRRLPPYCYSLLSPSPPSLKAVNKVRKTSFSV